MNLWFMKLENSLEGIEVDERGYDVSLETLLAVWFGHMYLLQKINLMGNQGRRLQCFFNYIYYI